MCTVKAQGLYLFASQTEVLFVKLIYNRFNIHIREHKMTVKSTLAVDMGGRYTGIFSYTTDSGFPKAKEARAYVLNMPDNDALTYSMAARTQTRHRIRSQQRFVLARRLTYILIEGKLKRKLSPREKEAISSLLRRRGYSRLESELDLSVLQGVESGFFKCFLPNFDEDENLLTQWTSLTDGYLQNNSDSRRQIQIFLESSKDSKEFLTVVKSQHQDTKEYKNALKVMRDDAESMIEQSMFGHKHRRLYLEAIAQDIPRDSRLKPIIEAFSGVEKFHHFIGNLSNLQLRALRWYFNDPSMKNNVFDKERLKSVLVRAYQFFHYPKDLTQQRAEVLNAYEGATDILETLQTLNPELTIPPYEDQNNRRPPLDQTLWLSPRLLDQRYGDTWEIWVQNLLRSPLSKGIDENLDTILITTDRKARLLERQSGRLIHYTSQKLYHSYVLQRLLDRTVENDAYLLKTLVSSNRGNSNEIHQAQERLTRDLGSQHIKKFLDFVRQYYDEVDKAKRGLWFIFEKPLMERADIHPPMKNDSVMLRLVGNILCVSDLVDLSFWTRKVKGQSTVRSLCTAIEKTRKEYGNSFNYLYQRALYLQSKGKKLSAEDKDFIKLQSNVLLVSDVIAEALDIKEEQKKKFANPFSLAQLYNIIETEKSGFISTTLAAVDENAWRNNLQGKARCVQLCADTVRPFDGALRNILDRQAYEIAKLKAEELLSTELKNQTIDLVVLLESNQFAFSASLAEVKKSANTAAIRQKVAKAQKRQQDRWLSKDERIKSASRGLCPYTGKNLGDKGEVDHIIPRSLSMNYMGSILNSEANLIYCSQEGNQLKLNGRKKLSDLADNYLKVVFGTADRGTICEYIEKSVSELTDAKIVQFELLDRSQQDAVRHALFLEDFSEARRRIIRLLGKINTARVNGTQAWFAKSFITKLRELTKEWCANNQITLAFDLYRLDAQTVSQDYRKKFALINKDWAKPDDKKQPIASHAIDAFCVFAAAKDKRNIANVLGVFDEVAEEQNLKTIAQLMPSEVNLISPKRKSILDKNEVGSRALMKEGIFAEHFLPILVRGDDCRIGFDWSESGSVKVKDADKLFGVLDGLLKQSQKRSVNGFETYTVDRIKAFELLHDVFIRPCSQKMLEQAEVLEKLHYITQNISVTSVYDAVKRQFKCREEILKDKDFDIKVDLGNRFGSAKGKITLPAKREWEKLVNRSELKNLIKDKLSDEGSEKTPDGETLIYDIFRSIPVQKLSHKATRRVWSLPKIPSISSGVRIKRKDSNGNDIYQLYMLNDTKCKGFVVNEKGVIDWSSDLVADLYKQPTLTILNGRYLKADQYVRMDQWYEVDCGRDDVIVKMCPGTSGRRYIEITQSKKQFEDWTGYISGSFWNYPVTIKLSSQQIANFVKNSQMPLLGKPRSGQITVITLGNTLKYWYCVESKNSMMNEAYQKAYLVHFNQ